MGKKTKPRVEFRYYKAPPGSPLLALLGEQWNKNYWRDVDYLHFHNYMEVGYCYDGEGELVLGEADYPFKGRSFSVIPRNFPHTTNSGEGTLSKWEYLFIDTDNFLGDCFKDNAVMKDLLIRRLNQKALFLSAESQPDIAGMIQKIMNLMRSGGEFYMTEVKSVLLSFLLEVARLNREETEEETEPRPGILINCALDYISDCYDRPIKIGTLASICNISEAHFRRVFHSSMGMTPNEYINLVRVYSACEFMQTSGESIADIAHKAGYDTLSTFNRNFKKVLGISPKKWISNPGNHERKLLNYNISTEKGW